MTWPLPERVWLPMKSTTPYHALVGLPTRNTPLSVKPLVTVRLWPLLLTPTSTSPLTLTPSRVPDSTDNLAPFVVTTVPPAIVQPDRLTALAPPSRTSTWLVLSTSPFSVMHPPALRNMPGKPTCILP